MILQALVKLYETLVAQKKLDPPGWSKSGISYALYIRDDGTLEQIVPIKEEVTRGKKTVLVPRQISLPAPVKRSSGIAPNFLWDNSSYILGIDNKGKPKRSVECFKACKALHHQILDGVASPAARAVLAFFDHWDPTQAKEHPALADKLDDILIGANFVFHCTEIFPQEDPNIRSAWQSFYDTESDGPDAICLVTGKKGPAEAVHPAIKGVTGAPSTGSALVSFNAPAFCSYGKEQSLNAPISKYAAFAYTSALNYLLADREHIARMGDSSILFWAQSGEEAYQNFFMINFLGTDSPYTASDLQSMVLKMFRGESFVFDETRLDPNTEFYILGLSPNSARLSVRFFLQNSFGEFIKNIRAHQERLEIVRPSFDQFDSIPIQKLLDETVNQKSKDKSPAPGMTGEVLRSMLTNTHYPATLLSGVTLRIRAERKITRGRAAILKAYYLQNPHPDVPKEVLQVHLNADSTNISYTLGRLFSIYEDIQSAANPGINTTIKDKYFNSAAAIPATIFPQLGNLAQKHLKKLRRGNKGLSIVLEKQIGELADVIGKEFPARLSLPQQGAFQLGYYHQTQERYRKKEDKKNV